MRLPGTVVAVAMCSILLASPLSAHATAQAGLGSPTVGAKQAGLAGSLSLVGSAAAGDVFAGGRLWDENVNWCDLQPEPDSDIRANLAAKLAPKVDAMLASGMRHIVLPLGHGAPWVFDNHPRALAQATRWSGGKRPIWFCRGAASAVSVPSPGALAPNPDGTYSPAQEDFANYVATTVDFLAQRYGDNVAFDLQVMNEPNLLNGLDPALRIPGAARTTAQAVAGLLAYEALVAELLASRPGLPFRLISTSLYQRTNTFMRSYLAGQNRRTTVAALAFNIYSRRQTPDAMITDWDLRAGRVIAVVKRYRNLRYLPRIVSETNHNLNNHKPRDRSNSSPRITATATQARLATATQLNALYRGFEEVFWILPGPNQAAVALQPHPGNPARAALANLAGTIGERLLLGCLRTGKVRNCYFRDPDGILPDARVAWRPTGTSVLRLTSATRIVTVSGVATDLPAGALVRVGTTPLVLLVSEDV